MVYTYIRDFKLNKEILKSLRKELRKAREDYRLSVKLSLEYDKHSTFKSLTTTEDARDYLVRDSRIVVELRHKIKMTKFRMRRSVRKSRKEVA